MAGRTTVARTWLEQAEADLRAAADSAKTGHHEWSCFQVQQAGEKALNAFLYLRGSTSVITHSLRRLLKECTALDSAFSELDDAARLGGVCRRVRTWVGWCERPPLGWVRELLAWEACG